MSVSIGIITTGDGDNNGVINFIHDLARQRTWKDWEHFLRDDDLPHIRKYGFGVCTIRVCGNGSKCDNIVIQLAHLNSGYLFF